MRMRLTIYEDDMNLFVAFPSVLEVCDDPLDILSCWSDEVDDREAGFWTTRRLKRVDDCKREMTEERLTMELLDKRELGRGQREGR